MDEIAKNPLVLVTAGAVATWIVQKILGYISDPAKTRIDPLKAALENNTRAMEALTKVVNDHEARVQVLEDFKTRHDREVVA